MWTVYLLVCVLLLVVCVVGRLVVRALWRAGPVGRASLAVGVALCGWGLYRAAVPATGAYLDEFARLSGVRLPASSEVLARQASFPDRYGRYTACFFARVAPSELPALQARMGAALRAPDAAVCKAMVIRPGSARYGLRSNRPGEQAALTVTVDPARGWLIAQWQVRRQLLGP